MAKKRKTTPNKKQAASKQRRAEPPGATADGGPVTLAEAKALAQAKSPRRALRRTAVVTAVSPETIGAERQKLERQRRIDNERRIGEYTATLTIMKQRGVKG